MKIIGYSARFRQEFLMKALTRLVHLDLKSSIQIARQAACLHLRRLVERHLRYSYAREALGLEMIVIHVAECGWRSFETFQQFCHAPRKNRGRFDHGCSPGRIGGIAGTRPEPFDCVRQFSKVIVERIQTLL